MNAVRSATRAACCMLCVTITIVTRCLQLRRSAPRSSASRSGPAPSTARPSGSPRARRRASARCTGAAAGRRRARRRARRAGRRPRPTGRRRAARPRPSRAGRPCLAAASARAEAQAGGDVVEHRHRRERVGLLKDHADRAAHRDDVDRRVVDVGVVEQHAPLGVRAGDLLVHAVDAAHHRRLAAARRADDRGDLVGAEVEVDALDLFGLAVEGAQLLERDAQPRLGLVQAARPRQGRRRARAALRRRIRSRSLSVWLSGSMSATWEAIPSDVMQGGSFARRGGR